MDKDKVELEFPKFRRKKIQVIFPIIQIFVTIMKVSDSNYSRTALFSTECVISHPCYNMKLNGMLTFFTRGWVSPVAKRKTSSIAISISVVTAVTIVIKV